MEIQRDRELAAQRETILAAIRRSGQVRAPQPQQRTAVRRSEPSDFVEEQGGVY